MTVAFTVTLVVFAGQGARGLLLGNFGASALVVLGLWWVLRARFIAARAAGRTCARCCASGCRRCRRTRACTRCRSPIAVPVPRLLARGGRRLLGRAAVRDGRVRGRARLPVRVAAAGVLDRQRRARRAAVLDRDDLLRARDGRGRVRRSRCSGAGSCGCSPPRRTSARTRRCRGWRSAWTLYGLYQVMIVITGRARVTSRNLPAAGLGLVVNIGLLFVLVPSSGLGLGIAGAGIALCAAYVAMLLVMHLLTRRLFEVGFEWARLAQLLAIFAGVAISGELLLPTSGARRPDPARRCGSRGSPRCCSRPASFIPTSASRRARSSSTAAGAWRRFGRGTARRGIRRGPAERPLTRRSGVRRGAGLSRARSLAQECGFCGRCVPCCDRADSPVVPSTGSQGAPAPRGGAASSPRGRARAQRRRRRRGGLSARAAEPRGEADGEAGRQERCRGDGAAGRRRAARDVRVLPRRDPAPGRRRRAEAAGRPRPAGGGDDGVPADRAAGVGGRQRTGGALGGDRAGARHARPIPTTSSAIRRPTRAPSWPWRSSSTGRCGAC